MASYFYLSSSSPHSTLDAGRRHWYMPITTSEDGSAVLRAVFPLEGSNNTLCAGSRVIAETDYGNFPGQ